MWYDSYYKLYAYKTYLPTYCIYEYIKLFIFLRTFILYDDNRIFIGPNSTL